MKRHLLTFVPHPTRQHVRARWGWMCSCGVKTTTQVMTKPEAQKDWRVHMEKMQ